MFYGEDQQQRKRGEEKRSAHKKGFLEEPCHCGGRSTQKVRRDDNAISLVMWATEFLMTREW